VRVQTGLETLLSERIELVRGRSAGLLCHPASVNTELRHAADLLQGAGVTLRCLFGPEHGVRGEAQDMEEVASVLDPRLQIPVHSLYGSSEESLRPEKELLEELDLVLIDIQDVGSRYYTYVWTMTMTIRVCGEVGVEVMVLDRPNPLGGTLIEGPTIEPDYTSFVGYHPVPVRHGMTAGEIARLVAAELGLDLSLEVVPMRGWRREHHFDDTSLPWVLPSPNMPTLDTAIVYPGGCLIEGTNLSEGRGTTRPFELLGAPWVDGTVLAAELDELGLPGVRFRPTSICPTFNKHAAQTCGAVQLHVTDRHAFRPFMTGVALLTTLRHLWPEHFGWRERPYEFVSDRPAIDLLAGGSWLRQGIEQGAPLHDLCADWYRQEEAFRERRSPYLLYRSNVG
jgi:uncharacterized protein YbbC (DUF1343 family)